MVQVSQIVLLASLIAAGCMLVARASSPHEDDAPSFVEIVGENELEALAANAKPDDKAASGEKLGGGGGLFGSNKIRIHDSRIVLTSRDRQQLITSLAQAMVADQKTAMAASKSNPNGAASTPLLPLTRDAFLYLKPTPTPDGSVLAVRIGWRYPLATWQTYKAFVTTEGCAVQRTIGDFFYC